MRYMLSDRGYGFKTRALATFLVVLFSVCAPKAGAFPLDQPKVARTNLVEKVSEGFWSQKDWQPASVRAAWNSVLGVVFLKNKMYEIGTTFLVKRVDNRGTSVLYFVSNSHVFAPFCNRLGICASAKAWQDLHARFDEEKDEMHFEAWIGPNFGSVEVLKITKYPDLVLFSVQVPTTPDLPEPLKISKTCDVQFYEPLYSVGFSATPLRKKIQVPIERRDRISKRWSQGLAMDVTLRKVTDEREAEFVFDTTIDLLPGGSGGPVLNVYGEVVGVQQAIADSVDFRYWGIETIDLLDWHSMAVPCGKLRGFLSEAFPSFE